jgi:sugar phosphate isomerase/epimerase
VDDESRRHLTEALEATGLAWIAEICTGGDYVPERGLPVAEHSEQLAERLRWSEGLGPLRVNCIGGQDAWTLDDSQRFCEAGMDVAARLGLDLCYETHRSRSLFNPWVTAALLERLPQLRLTADVSHWCVVAERLITTEPEVIDAMAAHVGHIHARVGYDQGPQVPHPAAPEYAQALAAHQWCWERFWAAQAERGASLTTLTPEFGADGYMHHLPFTDVPVADLWSINQWMAHTERAHFQRWRDAALTN